MLEGSRDGGDEEQRAAAASAAQHTTSLVSCYEAVDGSSGAPAPLAPSLLTLSLLPRSQWESLVHLEAIKARNK